MFFFVSVGVVVALRLTHRHCSDVISPPKCSPWSQDRLQPGLPGMLMHTCLVIVDRVVHFIPPFSSDSRTGFVLWVACGAVVSATKLETYVPVWASYVRTLTSELSSICFGGCTTCFIYDIYKIYICVPILVCFIFFLGYSSTLHVQTD